MIIGLFADLHLTTQDPYSPLDSQSGLSIRTLDKLEALENAIKKSIYEGAKYFFILGDLYDKMNPTEKLKGKFWEVITRYISQIKVVMFPGNHDGIQDSHNYLSEKSIIDSLISDRLFIIDKAGLYTFDNQDFLILPHHPDYDMISQLITEYRSKQVICLGHLEIIGALSSTEIKLKSGLPSGMFVGFKATFMGHYHRFQEFAPNCFYTGSPIIKDFSELGVKKGFLLYNTVSDSHSFIQLEKREFFHFIISPETLDEVDQFLEVSPPSTGGVFKIEFKGTSHWIQQVLSPVIDIFSEYKPLKVIKKFTRTDEKTSDPQELDMSKSRRDRIKEIASAESADIGSFGLKLYDDYMAEVEE